MNDNLVNIVVLTTLSFGAIQGFVFSIIAYFQKEYLLSTWLGLFSFEVVNKVLLTNQILPEVTQWLGYWFSLDLLYGPLLYLWVIKLLTGKKLARWQYLHFVPFVVYLSFKMPAILTWPLNTRIDGIVDGLINGNWMNPASSIDFVDNYIMFLPAVYSALTLYLLVMQRLWLKPKQGNALNVRFDWLLYMVVLQMVMWLFIIFTIHHFPFGPLNNWLISYIPAIIWLNILAGLSVSYQRFVAMKVPLPLTQKTEQMPKPAPFDPLLGKKIEAELESAMASNVFKQPKLSLDQLANHTGIANYLISQVLNEHLNCNFFDYVNGYRIRAIKAVLKLPENQQTILEIAFANGFNSKSTFNTCFKKQVGMTPSQYRLQQRCEPVNVIEGAEVRIS